MKPADQINTSASALSELSGLLPALAAEVQSTWLETRRDGYPAASLSEGTGASNITHVFRNPDGTEVELTVPQHSDPVGELIVQRSEDSGGEPIYVSLRQAASWLREAEQLAEKARGVLISAVNPPDEPPAEEDPFLFCQVCIRVTRTDSQGRKSKVMNPTHTVEALAAGDPPKARCGACEAWAHEALTNPQMAKERPKSLIIKEADGRRLTTRDFDEAIGGAA
jgi:hypothetical protein